MLRREVGNLSRLSNAGVVLPEPALSVEVFLPLPVERERTILRIDRDRARAGGVDTDADDLVSREPTLLFRGDDGTANRLLEANEIVAGMLTRERVVFWIQQHALMTAGIIDDRGAELRAVRATHDKCAHRVGAVINAEGEHGEGGELFDDRALLQDLYEE